MKKIGEEYKPSPKRNKRQRWFYAAEIASKLKEKPLSRSELARELGISERNSTLDRAIELLQRLGFVRKREDGKYEWVEGWQIFLDEEGYKIKLEHSKELLRCFIEQSDLLPPSESDLRNEHLLQHLKSGYPDIYYIYEKWIEGKVEYSKYKEEIEKLALKVKHGEPLKGYCGLCPRVEIKKLAEHRDS